MLLLCPAAAALTAGTGVEALLSPVEASMVDELNAELRETLSDFRYVYMLTACCHIAVGMFLQLTRSSAQAYCCAVLLRCLIGCTKESCIACQTANTEGSIMGHLAMLTSCRVA